MSYGSKRHRNITRGLTKPQRRILRSVPPGALLFRVQLNELCHSYLDEPCEPWGDRHLDEIKSIRTGDRIPFQSTYLGKYNLGGLYLRVKLKCTGIQTTLSGN